MNLASYVAKWGWGSLFVLLWLKTLGFLEGRPDLTLVAFVVFGGLAILSTIIYALLIRTAWRYNKGAIKG